MFTGSCSVMCTTGKSLDHDAAYPYLFVWLVLWTTDLDGWCPPLRRARQWRIPQGSRVSGPGAACQSWPFIPMSTSKVEFLSAAAALAVVASLDRAMSAAARGRLCEQVFRWGLHTCSLPSVMKLTPDYLKERLYRITSVHFLDR